MNIESDNINIFFKSLHESDETVKAKEEVSKEFNELYDSYLKSGLSEANSKQKAEDNFLNLNERFANLIEERDFMIEVNKAINVISVCQVFTFLLKLMLFTAPFTFGIIDSLYEIEAGSFLDMALVGAIVLNILLTFILCNIPDKKISAKAKKYIIEQRQLINKNKKGMKGMNIGSIRFTFFPLTFLYSAIGVFVFAVCALVQLLKLI